MSTKKITTVMVILILMIIINLLITSEIDPVKAMPFSDQPPPTPEPKVERSIEDLVPLAYPATILEALVLSESDFPINPKIVGGTEVSPENAYPWLVSLQYQGFHYCGGTLIDPEWILTAAHCWVDLDTGIVYPITVDDTVVLGEHSLSITSGREQEIGFAEVHVHPSFNHITFENDFALLKLSSPATLNAYVQTINLVGASPGDLTGQSSVIAGWGATVWQGAGSDVAREATISILANSSCSSYGLSYDSTTMLCAGTVDGSKDSCQGDSGGPLAFDDGGTWKQAGVVSWGHQCAVPGYPGVYSRISSAYTWIQGIVSTSTIGNDDMVDATVISSLPYSTTQSTVDATTETGEPSYSCGSSIGNTVWYSYTPGTDGLFTAHTNGSDFDTVMHVFEDTGGLPLVLCNDDDAVELSPSSRLSFEGQAGTTYLISIGGYFGDSGNLSFSLEQVCNDPNSLCVTAKYPYGGQAFYPDVDFRESDGAWAYYFDYISHGSYVEFTNTTPGVDYLVVTGTYGLYIVEENVTAPGIRTASIESPVYVNIETKDTGGAYLNNSYVYFDHGSGSVRVGNTYDDIFSVWASPDLVHIDTWNPSGGYYFYEPNHTLVNGATISLDASTLPYETVEMNLDGLSSVGYVPFSPTTSLAYVFNLVDGEAIHLVAPLDSSDFWAFNHYAIDDGAKTWFYGFNLPSVKMDTHLQNNIITMGGTLWALASTSDTSYAVGETGYLYGDLLDGYGNTGWELYYEEEIAPDLSMGNYGEEPIIEISPRGERILQQVVYKQGGKNDQARFQILPQEGRKEPRLIVWVDVEPDYYLNDALSNPVSGTEYGWGMYKYLEFTAAVPTGTWEGGFTIDTGPAEGVIGDSVDFSVAASSGIELLTNTSLENELPADWMVSRGIEAVDGRDCATKHSGSCSWAVDGNDAEKRITFHYRPDGSAGDTFDFSIWRKGINTGGTGYMVAEIKIIHQDGSIQKEMVNLGGGTIANWEQRTGTITALENYQLITVSVIYKKPGGTLWVDDVSLVRNTTTQLMSNPSFELSMPQGWSYARNHQVVDGRDCTTSLVGNCSWEMNGNGVEKRIVYHYRPDGSAGETFNFSIWRKGINTVGTGYMVAEIKIIHQDGSLQKEMVNLSGGTIANWEQRTGTITALENYQLITVSVIYKKPGGTLWVDDISLMQIP